MTLLVIFIGGKVNQSIMEEIHIQTINGFVQKVVMRAKKRAVIDATKAHPVNSNWMGTTNSKHHIHLQSNVGKYSSHLVIHANRFIVALTNPFLTDIQVAAHDYRKKIA